MLLWLVAVVIDLCGIQQAPLRDWDESLVARVALELSEKPWPDLLLPTFWGAPYENKPPGAHWLIAALIHLWRVWGEAKTGALPPEWLLRLGPALGSSLLVPLLGLVQWQLRPGRRADALWTAVISLSLLPLARHAHLAMLDGLQLTAMAMCWLGLLLSRSMPPLLPGLMAGLAGSALLLLKAPVALPVVLASLALRWTDRELDRGGWSWLLLGLAMGLTPSIAWHGWHLAGRGESALVMWGRQGLARVVSAVENHRGGPIPPLIQVLSGGWPWLPLWPLAIAQAWRERSLAWGRWSLGLTALVSLLVLPLQTQLPWYSLLLWPPFALCCAPMIARLLSPPERAIGLRGVAWIWLALGLALSAACLIGTLPASPSILRSLSALALPAAVGLVIAGLALRHPGDHQPPAWRQRRNGLLALVAGWCLSLLLLFLSPVWNWELNQKPSIVPVLRLLPGAPTATGATETMPLAITGPMARRPSLQWYLGARPASDPWISQGSPAPFLVISDQSVFQPSRPIRFTHQERSVPLQCALEAEGLKGWKRWRCLVRVGAAP